MLLRKKKTYREKFEGFYLARNPNEKILLIIVVFFAAFYMIHDVYLASLQEKMQTTSTSIASSKKDYEAKQQALETVEEEILDLREKTIEKDIEDLKQEVKALDNKISNLSSSLSSPEKTKSLIHDILNSYPSVSLISLDNTQPTATEELSSLLNKDLYLHEISIVCEASYPVLIEFFKDFESKQPLITGKTLVLERTNYPLIKAKVSYEIYSYTEEFVDV